MFFLFAVSVSWILVNVMLTIIIDGYEQVKKELEGQKNDLEVIQYIKVDLLMGSFKLNIYRDMYVIWRFKF